MAKKKDDVNKSLEIAKLLQADPKMPVSQVMASLGERGIKISDALVYHVRGKMAGRKGRRRKARKMVEKVVAVTASANGDAVKTILQVKGWASEVGGLKKLKALVDALSE